MNKKKRDPCYADEPEIKELVEAISANDWASGPNESFRHLTQSGDNLWFLYFRTQRKIHIYKTSSLEGFEDGRWKHDYARDLLLSQNKNIKIAYPMEVLPVDAKNSLNKLIKNFILKEAKHWPFYRYYRSKRLRHIHLFGTGKTKTIKNHHYEWSLFCPNELFYMQNHHGGILKMEKLYEVDVEDYMIKKKLPYKKFLSDMSYL